MAGQRSDIVIVGGSVAATRAAETAAWHAPDLSITVVSDEAVAAYERPPLSKLALDDPVDLAALTYPVVDQLREQGVVFTLGTRAEQLDVAGKRVMTSQGAIECGAVVVATGCEPVVPPLFAGRPDVYVLRTHADAVGLRRAVADPARTVAVVGAGFIGGEFAATMVKAGREVALIDLDPNPLGRLGPPVAHAYRELHRAAGVHLHFGRAVVDIVEEADGRALRLDDGTTVTADVIVLGVGVRPTTGWLQDSGLTLDGGVVCDETLRAAEGVYAAGDIVRWPNARFGETMRIEHWTNAAEQGRVAGLNAVSTVLGNPAVACSTVPYFWSDQHGVRIQFAGHRTGMEEILEDRNGEGALFLYRSGDRVAGVLAFERRAQFVRLRAALRRPLSWSAAAELGVFNPVPTN